MKQVGAFVEEFRIAPTGKGALDGLTFAVKDLIQVAGRLTGCGNPSWRDTHPLPSRDAPCVAQLLAAGATCVGTTITDELAYSLLGENPWYGTPLNSRAPDRVPGGSSSGSAAAVAAGAVAFALGTDTGGSVRIPAHNCGVWGFRPTPGAVSLEGVVPLAPTFDTVGVLAGDPWSLAAAGAVLTRQLARDAEPHTVLVVNDLFDLADAKIADALRAAPLLHRWGSRLLRATFRDLVGADASDLAEWRDLYKLIQPSEAWAAHRDWITEVKPVFGPAAKAGFAIARSIDPGQLPAARRRFEELRARLRRAIPANTLLCLPTAPCLAPRKGEQPSRDEPNGYYARTLAFTAIAGIGGLPQVSMPAAEVEGVPAGLSLLAGSERDAFLLGVTRTLAVRRPDTGNRTP